MITYTIKNVSMCHAYFQACNYSAKGATCESHSNFWMINYSFQNAGQVLSHQWSMIFPRIPWPKCWPTVSKCSHASAGKIQSFNNLLQQRHSKQFCCIEWHSQGKKGFTLSGTYSSHTTDMIFHDALIVCSLNASIWSLSGWKNSMQDLLKCWNSGRPHMSTWYKSLKLEAVQAERIARDKCIPQWRKCELFIFIFVGLHFMHKHSSHAKKWNSRNDVPPLAKRTKHILLNTWWLIQHTNTHTHMFHDILLYIYLYLYLYLYKYNSRLRTPNTQHDKITTSPKST